MKRNVRYIYEAHSRAKLAHQIHAAFERKQFATASIPKLKTQTSFYDASDVLQELFISLMHAMRTYDSMRGELTSHVWYTLWQRGLQQQFVAHGFKRTREGLINIVRTELNDDIVASELSATTNRVATILSKVTKTQEEFVVITTLRKSGAKEFAYADVCEALPWWSENINTQRRSFERVVRTCAARL
jgi:hypothetical protein